MQYKVGVPHGMFFYDYFPLWKEFLTELDVEVIISPKTNKKILDDGVISCIDDACLPVKVFHGHIFELKDKVDFLYIPKIVSIYEREYNCPKIIGLTDMVRNTIKDLPPIIDSVINLKKTKYELVDAVIDSGRYFTNNKFKIGKAYRRAYGYYRKYIELIRTGIMPHEALELMSKNINLNQTEQRSDYSIMVLGHPYNIYDEHISMNLISKLKKSGLKVITAEMVDINKINYYSSQLSKRMFWSCGRKLIGSSFYLMENQKLDGLIYVSSFGCGLDSILIDIIRRRADILKIPFTLITIDEHTGEAGINTRIEAFIDMIKWRSRNEDYISSHG